jgi:hypothetical protein
MVSDLVHVSSGGNWVALMIPFVSGYQVCHPFLLSISLKRGGDVVGVVCPLSLVYGGGQDSKRHAIIMML